jgi:Flp pilus assembly protein TadD
VVKAGDEMEHATKDAEGGDHDAMYRMGNLLLGQGDLDGAEAWYRRAAQSGNTRAMHNLGIVLAEKGDLIGAEAWYRRAALVGHASSMSNLGSILKEGGDLDGAEEWYRKAANGGNAYAMSNLGLLLAERGDLAGAEKWYLQAAGMGNTGAMHNLGYMLQRKGDLDGAEEWYRRSVKGGNKSTMINLGMLRQDRGDVVAAEAWFRRAVEAGITKGEGKLTSLEAKLRSDGDLEAMTFDTFGWDLTRNRDKFRVWRTHDTSLAVTFSNRPSGFKSWDPDQVRDRLTQTVDLLGVPGLSVDRLDVTDWIWSHVPRRIPEQISLLETACFEIPPARCVLAVTRHRLQGSVHYTTGLFVLFSTCFWLLKLSVEEHENVGEREGAVARRILERSAGAEIPGDDFDPYDRQWDGIVPIEDDPLTRMRMLVDRLRSSICFAGPVAGFDPFAPTGDP